MRTISEVSSLTGVSLRTLHYYDEIGLFPPSSVTEAGYRLYDDEALERLQIILLFRELMFPLREIRTLLNSPDFDRNRALEQQIELLRRKKEHLDNLITLASGLHGMGMRHINFRAFDTRAIDEYAARARDTWNQTAAWKELEQRHAGQSPEELQRIEAEITGLVMRFGEHVGEAPDTPELLALAEEFQDIISASFYTCTPQILGGLAGMLDGGGTLTESIDAIGGGGTADLAAAAIRAYAAHVSET